MAEKRPIGTLIKVAMPTMTKVPIIALPKPPPISKAEGGNAVIASQSSREPPSTNNM